MSLHTELHVQAVGTRVMSLFSIYYARAESNYPADIVPDKSNMRIISCTLYCIHETYSKIKAFYSQVTGGEFMIPPQMLLLSLSNLHFILLS